MRVLTVYAHPNPKSFCHAVLEQFTAGLRDAGHSVEVVDLYAIKFDPVFRQRDLATYLHEDIPPEILESMNLRRAAAGERAGRPGRAPGRLTVAARQDPSADREVHPRACAQGCPRAMAEGRRRRRAGVHRAGVLAALPRDPQGLVRARLRLRQRVRAHARGLGRALQRPRAADAPREGAGDQHHAVLRGGLQGRLGAADAPHHRRLGPALPGRQARRARLLLRGRDRRSAAAAGVPAPRLPARPRLRRAGRRSPEASGRPEPAQRGALDAHVLAYVDAVPGPPRSPAPDPARAVTHRGHHVP